MAKSAPPLRILTGFLAPPRNDNPGGAFPTKNHTRFSGVRHRCRRWSAPLGALLGLPVNAFGDRLQQSRSAASRAPRVHVYKRGYTEQAGEALADALLQRPRRRALHLEPVTSSGRSRAASRTPRRTGLFEPARIARARRLVAACRPSAAAWGCSSQPWGTCKRLPRACPSPDPSRSSHPGACVARVCMVHPPIALCPVLSRPRPVLGMAAIAPPV